MRLSTQPSLQPYISGERCLPQSHGIGRTRSALGHVNLDGGGARRAFKFLAAPSDNFVAGIRIAVYTLMLAGESPRLLRRVTCTLQ